MAKKIFETIEERKKRIHNYLGCFVDLWNNAIEP